MRDMHYTMLALKSVVARHTEMLRSCLEGKDLTYELKAVSLYVYDVNEAIRDLEIAWRRHQDFLESTEEGRELIRELCMIDSRLEDIRLGGHDEPLP